MHTGLNLGYVQSAAGTYTAIRDLIHDYPFTQRDAAFCWKAGIHLFESKGSTDEAIL